MEENPNTTAFSSEEPEVLDIKPLRSLAPMFPMPLGFDARSPPNARPFVFVTPFGQFSSSPAAEFPKSFTPLFPSYDAAESSDKDPNPRKSPHCVRTHERPSDGDVHGDGHANSNGFVHPSELVPSFQMPPTNAISINSDDEEPLLDVPSSIDGMKAEQPVPISSYRPSYTESDGTNGKSVKRKRLKKAHDLDLMMLPSSSQDTIDSVEVILMTFDALRRRLLQLEEVNDENKRSQMRAGSIMIDNDLRANKLKRIGAVSGVETGDIFFFRIEMCLVGLHAQSVGGIDYVNVKFEQDDEPVAVCIVSSGGYENDDDNIDVLIYTGQGGAAKNDKKKLDDQKLERGNLALERSLHRGFEIRVIRSAKDLSCQGGKIYIYDGLYTVQSSWTEKGKSGYNVFKYKLVREPGQPDAFAIWKMTEKWKQNPSSRGKVILPDISSGLENLPVCLVNEVDEEKGPSHFTYVTTVSCLSSIGTIKPLQSCMCHGMCLPGDANCSCAEQNGGCFPYCSTGLLVSHKPLIYECGALCQCSVHCRNRLTQRGIALHFEVFRTKDRGWGLRSWDPIRAGMFICEYTGEIIDKVEEYEDGEEDYLFQPMHDDDRALKWNYIPELLGEPSSVDPNEGFKPLPIVISAKRMGNISRFMNHSCSPNVFSQAVLYDHGNEGYPHIMFFAKKHIPPMTELTYDYGSSRAEFGQSEEGSRNVFRRPKNCLCGSSKCRGHFG